MATPTTFLRAYRTLALSLLAAPVAIAVAMAFVLGPDGTETPPYWALAAVAVWALAAGLVIAAVGYKVTPIAPATPEPEARTAAAGAFQSSAILRFALAESVAIGAVVLAFVVDQGGLIVCLLGLVLYLALALMHVWPGDRMVQRVQDALERDGGTSYLRAALDAPPTPRA